MATLENVLKAYQAGALSPKCAELKLALLITPENVDLIMPQVPPEIIEMFSRWDFDKPRMIIGNNLSEATRKREEAQLAVAILALRDWFARHSLGGNGELATADPARERVKS